MKITVIGSGYVGLVTGVCFAELGHEVTIVDNDRQKVRQLERGELPIHEKFLPELVQKHRSKSLFFTSDLSEAVGDSTAVFIAVGTPPAQNGQADLSYFECVARDLAHQFSGYKVIVEKSTVPIYTSEWVRKVMLLNGASPDGFDVVSNPEFLREGSAVTDFLYPDRIVVGADSQRGAKVLQEIYAPLTSGRYHQLENAIPSPDGARHPAPLILMSTGSAELTKHASNAFLAMKISFINAVSSICEHVGADIQQVCTGIGADSRIGERFLNPGIGYGGSCFPKDISAFRAVAKESGYDFRLLDEVVCINEEQRLRFLKKVRSALWTIKGKRLAVLGLAFKGGTDDIRESPAIAVVEEFLKEGAHVAAYDPAAMSRARAHFGSECVKFTEDPYAACRGADALLILTEWEEFGNLDLVRIRRELRYPVIVDGRNLYNPADMLAAGFSYHSVGRRAVEAWSLRARGASNNMNSTPISSD